jgi:light-regulated signal transduction histidine kinase (bacteriophytochrome)
MKKDSVPLTDQAKNYVDKIMESTMRMKKLVEDLLNYSGTDAKKKFKRTNLNHVFKDALKDFDAIITSENAQVSGNNLPVIYAVPVQMKQLFHNLLSNSLKFRKTNVAPVITIDWHRISDKAASRFGLREDLAFCEIIFKDNGIGFSKKFNKKIFEIFQRLHEKEKYEGTGIGLALCRKIVHNHGGEIFAEAQENKGATFHIILPMNNNTYSAVRKKRKD